MKKILRLCVAIILCTVGLAVSVGAADVLYSGTCGAEGDGSNLTWSLDSEGVLRIEGKGRMKDFDSSDAPWSLCKSDIIAVNISEGVTSIGEHAFYSCDSLTAINVAENNQYYSNDERGVLFNKDKTILMQYPIGNTASSYIIPSSVTSIGEHAFDACYRLTSVTIPSSVTSIGEHAFSSCVSLTSVSIPSSVTSIGEHAFSGCDSLTSVTIPSSVTSIGDYAFRGCDSLTSVTIPSSVTSIGEGAFYDCYSLTSVTIPSSVTSIGDYAFCDCDSLTAINVAENNQYYSNDERGVLFNKDKTILMQYPIGNTASSYIIPSSVTSIGNRSFSGCDSLTSVTIPSSVTSIGDYAFYFCDSLTSVTLPSSVTSIGDYAFSGCDSLTSVTIPSSVTSIGGCAFNFCDNLQTVYYNGTREQFDKIEISIGNVPLTRAELILGSTAVPQSHPVLSTDIRSYIYGSEIESYNVNGSTCVVAEDLMNYGFTVLWDGNARTLSVTHPSEDFSQEIKRDFGAKTGSIGEKIAETVPTDIVTYVNGKVVPSFNIGGRTVIYIDSLAVFGGVVWDGGARTISLG